MIEAPVGAATEQERTMHPRRPMMTLAAGGIALGALATRARADESPSGFSTALLHDLCAIGPGDDTGLRDGSWIRFDDDDD